MDSAAFEKAVTDAILAVPEHIRAKMDNVAFVVEEAARPAGPREHDIRHGRTLLGLYQGIPLPSRNAGYTFVLPDKITIFQQPIEAVAGSDERQIRQLVAEVVHHEIGHYFGFSEAEVRRWEQRRRPRQ